MEELSRIKRLGRKVTIDWKPWRPATSEEKLNNLKRKKKLSKWVKHIRNFSTDSREGYSIAFLAHFIFVIFIFFLCKQIIDVRPWQGFNVNKMFICYCFYIINYFYFKTAFSIDSDNQFFMWVVYVLFLLVYDLCCFNTHIG